MFDKMVFRQSLFLHVTRLAIGFTSLRVQILCSLVQFFEVLRGSGEKIGTISCLFTFS